MIVVRSWPRHPRNPDQPRVVDDLRRVYVDDYDYRPLVELGDDVVQLDWDTAASLEDLNVFADRARRAPERVLVAPCRVYPDSRAGLSAPVWNLKRYLTGEQATRYAREGEDAHLFGFGMVYLPAALIRGYVEAWPGKPLGDIAFAQWHYRTVGEAAVAWDVRPVHLHYRADLVG